LRPYFALAALAATACGGGAPLLHGAHTLPTGRTAAGAGFSGTFAFGGAGEAARSGSQAERRAAEGAFSPGVAPWVGLRVGLGAESEAGLTYTGRAVRFDARHAFEDDSTALSIGAGASAIVGAGEQPTDVSTPAAGGTTNGPLDRPTGFGFDVPVLFGWRSTAGVVTLWAGPRGGFEKLTANSSSAQALDVRHWYGGAVVGLGLGFRHVHGAIELDGYYQTASGSVAGESVHASGVTLAPAAGLIFSF
jgi:hypothetical protein